MRTEAEGGGNERMVQGGCGGGLRVWFMTLTQ